MSKQCYEHKNELPCRQCGSAAMDAIVSPATRRNIAVQARYDELARLGKHGHYETMFQVVREAVEAAREECAVAAESVGASRYPEASIDWNDGFGRGADAAADRIREITNPQKPTAA